MGLLSIFHLDILDVKVNDWLGVPAEGNVRVNCVLSLNSNARPRSWLIATLNIESLESELFAPLTMMVSVRGVSKVFFGTFILIDFLPIPFVTDVGLILLLSHVL